MERATSQKQTLKRDLGLWTVVLLVIANTFSGSIFVLLSEGAMAAGTLLPLSYLFGAFLALLIGSVYAEVSSSMPEAGANMAYAFSAYGRGTISFILSWLTILGHIAYGAVNAFGFGLYLTVFTDIPAGIIGIATVILFSLINLFGVKGLGHIGKWSVLTSMSLVLLFAILVCLNLDFSFERATSLFQVPLSEYPSIFAGTALIFAAFIGFEGVSSLAREIKDPHKNVPRATFLVIGLTSVIYVGIAFLVVYALPIQELAHSGAPLSLLAREEAGSVANIAVIIAALLATGTALLMDILVSSRKVYAAADIGYLPRILKRVSGKGAPYFAVFVVGASMIALLLSNSLAFIAYLGNATYLFFAAMLCLGVIAMRKKRPYLHRPFRVPLFPFVPLLAIILSVVVILSSGITALFWLLVWIVLGFVVYLASFIERRRFAWIALGVMVSAFALSLLFLPIIV